MSHDRSEEVAWARLLGLLDPIHEKAMTTARRLARTSDEGDDLYQEAVLHAFRKLDALREDASFRSWFFAILLSKHRTRARRGFWRRLLPLEGPAGVDAGPAVDPGFGETEWLRAWRMRSALAALPEGERETLVLFEMQGFSTEEIAAMQHVTPSTVRSRLTRGRRRLAGIYVRRGWADAKEKAAYAAMQMGGLL